MDAHFGLDVGGLMTKSLVYDAQLFTYARKVHDLLSIVREEGNAIDRWTERGRAKVIKKVSFLRLS